MNDIEVVQSDSGRKYYHIGTGPSFKVFIGDPSMWYHNLSSTFRVDTRVRLVFDAGVDISKWHDASKFKFTSWGKDYISVAIGISVPTIKTISKPLRELFPEPITEWFCKLELDIVPGDIALAVGLALTEKAGTQGKSVVTDGLKFSIPNKPQTSSATKMEYPKTTADHKPAKSKAKASISPEEAVGL